MVSGAGAGEVLDSVLAAIAAFNADGDGGLIRFCDPAIEWRTTGRVADQGTYRGFDGVRMLVGELSKDLGNLRMLREGLEEVNRRAVIHGRMTGQGRSGGAPFELVQSVHIRSAHGKFVEVRQFTSAGEALEAAERLK